MRGWRWLLVALNHITNRPSRHQLLDPGSLNMGLSFYMDLNVSNLMDCFQYFCQLFIGSGWGLNWCLGQFHFLRKSPDSSEFPVNKRVLICEVIRWSSVSNQR